MNGNEEERQSWRCELNAGISSSYQGVPYVPSRVFCEVVIRTYCSIFEEDTMFIIVEMRTAFCSLRSRSIINWSAIAVCSAVQSETRLFVTCGPCNFQSNFSSVVVLKINFLQSKDYRFSLSSWYVGNFLSRSALFGRFCFSGSTQSSMSALCGHSQIGGKLVLVCNLCRLCIQSIFAKSHHFV